MAFADEEGDFVHPANHTPGGVHHIHAALLVVSGHHQNRHWVHSRHNSKVFFHCFIFFIVLQMIVISEETPILRKYYLILFTSGLESTQCLL
jgi:hypothetical protein